MFGSKKDVDGDISNLKYEISLLKENLKSLKEQQEKDLTLLRTQLSKISEGKVVTSKAITEGMPFDVVGVEELEEFISEKVKDGKIVDVRTDSEWKQGHLKDSTHIPIHLLENKLEELESKGTYFLICSTGQRSLTACELMLGKGFTSVFQVEGGLGRYTGELEKEEVVEQTQEL